jgi:malate dehydrogenase (oxaloacetate-decarboxylating)
MHDDVHGTAVVSVAAAIVACRNAGVDIREATIGQLGLGAAGFGIAALMVQGGAKRVVAYDPQEASHARAREAGIEVASMETVLEQADVVVATTGRPGLIKPEMIRKGQVILALSNPDPEIDPELAEQAGAAFAADGRSVNNVLGYPGIFRGALHSGAPVINLEMKLAAALAIANQAVEGELVPDPLNQSTHDAVADAVAAAAERSGVARPVMATAEL